MDPRLYAIEPFPTYIDAPPNPQFKTRLSGHPLLFSPYLASKRSALSDRKPSIFTRVADHLRLRYYQYEVTFGLYVMTPGERLVLNAFVVAVIALISWALYWGLKPFLLHTFCRIVYYTTGSLQGKQELCRVTARELPRGYMSGLAKAYTTSSNTTFGATTLFAS